MSDWEREELREPEVRVPFQSDADDFRRQLEEAGKTEVLAAMDRSEAQIETESRERRIAPQQVLLQQLKNLGDRGIEWMLTDHREAKK